jgi:hypothetical protein
MPRQTKRESVSLVKEIYAEHQKYWDEQRPSMKRLNDVYMMRFWDDMDNPDAMVQVADARTQVESYIASLFSKAPSVVVGGDPQASKGSNKHAEVVINRFLEDEAETMTTACRLALIFPCSFLFLGMSDGEDVLDRIYLEALKPWEVIIDRTASTWKAQRYTGKISQITIARAKELYGDKDYIPEEHIDFLNVARKSRRTSREKGSGLPEEYLYVTIVELWDRLSLKKIIWTPCLQSNEGYLATVEAMLDDAGRMSIPIVPLYLNTDPSAPLKGFSFIATIYSQVKEKNLLRSQMQQQVRRDTRQILYRKGAIDEETLAQLVNGNDMTFIGIDGENVGQAIAPLQNIPLSSNYDKYLSQIEADLERANVMAAFSRGQSTNVTATEISALAQYTQSEVGKLARIRDTAIETIGSVYLKMLWCLVDDKENEQVVLLIEGKPAILSTKDIEGRFSITAVDQGSLPISQAAKEAKLVQLLPTLKELGVPQEELLKLVVQTFDLDPMLLDAASKAVAEKPAAPGAPSGALPGQPPMPGMPPIA